MRSSGRFAGRFAGAVFVCSAVFTAAYVVLPVRVASRPWLFVLIGLVVLVGTLAWFAPWDRWPHAATLALVPLALAFIAAGRVLGPLQPYTYGLFFLVVFVWVGVTQPRWTSLKVAPLAAIAYVVPILVRPEADPYGAASALVSVPVALFVGETLALMRDREIRTSERSRTLARAVAVFASELDEERLLEVFVREVRGILGAEHVVLFRLEGSTVRRVVFEGIGPHHREWLEGFEGASLEGVPAYDEVLSKGERLVLPDVREDRGPLSEATLEALDLRSVLALPVSSPDGVAATLSCLETARPRSYSDEDIHLARTLIDELSVALQNAELYARIQEAARNDPLTDLGNRRAFREDLAEELDRAGRYGRSLTLLLVDADGFKRVNDEWGHAPGDRVLRSLGMLLVGAARGPDRVYRVGGDEFAFVLPETGRSGGEAAAHRLGRIVRRAYLGVPGLGLTVSVGVATFPEQGTTVDELFGVADDALFQAKSLGGDIVGPRAGGRTPLVDLPSVLGGRGLRAVFQPVVDLASGGTLGYEAFGRLLRPEVPTPLLFRMAGTSGRVPVLDAALRQVVLREVRALPGSVPLFLNISPLTLEDEAFRAAELCREVVAAGLDPEQVVLEVTEEWRAPDSAVLVSALEACRRMGFRLALDDFGVGVGDLELLARVPFDYVKADMTFVRGSAGASERPGVLRSLCLIGQETGAVTIAEGVETVEDLWLVTEVGFVGAQGFALGRPSPVPLAPSLCVGWLDAAEVRDLAQGG